MSSKAIDRNSQLSVEVEQVIMQIAREANITDFKIDVKEQAFSGDNYFGDIKRVKITPHDVQAKPINLILKVAPLAEVARKTVPIVDFYKNETLIYTSFIPIIKDLQQAHKIPEDERISFAQFYKSILEDSKELIVLRDLTDFGFTMRDKRNFLDFDHASLILQDMAKLHAVSFVLKQTNMTLFENTARYISKSMNFGESLKTIIVELAVRVETVIKSPVNREKLILFNVDVEKKLFDLMDAQLTEPYNVICHGDSVNNNFLFKYQDDQKTKLVFIDWQMSRLASPLTDVCYMMCLSMDLEVFEHRLQELLDIYYETLSITITRMGCEIETSFPRSIFEQHVKRSMHFGLILGLCGIPMSLNEPTEAISIEDTAKNLADGRIDVVINETATQRLNQLVDIFVRHGFI